VAKASDQEIISYLGEHLPYELLMLRYTRSLINRDQQFLDWNAFYESFAVHARNLYHFFIDRDGRKNMTITAMTSGFDLSRPIHIDVIIDKLNEQVVHKGKSRAKIPLEKIDITIAEQIFDWLESRVSPFEQTIKLEYRSHWRPELSDLSRISKSTQLPGLSHPTTSTTPSTYSGVLFTPTP